MNQKRKFPLFDLLLLLVIAAGIAGGVFWFNRRRSESKAEIQYSVTFPEVESAYAGSFTIGKEVFGEDGLRLGSIVRSIGTASVIRTFDRTPKEEGAYLYRQSRSDALRDVTLTVTVTAERRSDGYYVGETQIAAGLELSMMLNGYAGTCLITSVSEVAQ